VETIPEKRGASIAGGAAVLPLRAAVSSSHFGHFARHDGGWNAQVSSLWASIRSKFLLPARIAQSALSGALEDRKPALLKARFQIMSGGHPFCTGQGERLPDDVEELRRMARAGFRRLQHRPDTLRAFFDRAHLRL
jgi:hypothetical protein